MKKYTTVFLLLFLLTPRIFSQAVGRLEISADLTAIAAYDPDIQISVINLSSNREVARKTVQEVFDFTFPLNGRFLLYLKKEGYVTTRLMLDTHTFMSGEYVLSFDLSMNELANQSNGNCLPIGTIKFDKKETCFGYKSTGNLAAVPLKVMQSVRNETEVVTF